MATIPASENEFPEVLFSEGAAPGTPASGLVKAYAKADGLLYSKDDAGAESALGVGAHLADTTDAHDSSAVSVDPTGLTIVTGTDVQTAIEELDAGIGAGGIPVTIFDAQGDLIVASAADTAARLALGASETVLRSNGTTAAWAVPSQVLIASDVKGSNAASFSFTSIAATYNHLRLICAVRCSGAVFDGVATIQLNNDTGSNYDRVFTGLASATTLNASESFGQTSGFVGYAPGASGVANVAGLLTIDIPLYAGTTFHKQVLSSYGYVGQSTGNDRLGTSVVSWRSTAAINRVDLLLTSGTNYLTGSAVYLYGIT